jgi:hypothetical protein
VTSARIVENLLTKSAELVNVPSFLGLKGVAEVRAGRRAEGRKILAQLEQMRKTQWVEPVITLELCAALGDREALMVWVRRAYEDRSSMMLYAPMASFLYDNDAGVKAYLAKTLGKPGT